MLHGHCKGSAAPEQNSLVKVILAFLKEVALCQGLCQGQDQESLFKKSSTLSRLGQGQSTLSVRVIKVNYKATTFSENKSHLVDVSPILAQQPQVLVAIGKPDLHELAHRLPLERLRLFGSKF